MAQKKPARKPRRKKVEAGSKGLTPADVGAERPADGEKLARLIEEDGGSALAVYREPLGGHTVVLAALPIDKVEPTPYQRDISETHVKRLANAMERVNRYLDPLIAVRHDGRYWTPNGNHRLGASRLLGARAVVALVMPEEDVAFQILALNTEKAHNLKERSLEVIRMYRGLVGARGKEQETEFAPLFEEPQFATFGAAYEKRPRYSAGAYSSLVKRLEGFQEMPLTEALEVREARADKLLAFDDAVVKVVAQLKEKGLTSPYLKNFVVARVNFLRFVKGDKVPDFDEAIDKMTASVAKIDPGSVKKEDLARMGGAPAEADEE
ncbi:MAG TPA: ParB N-terminal domain-containing protein [Myxococcales bacterium]|nr:ParB N-terminal domain-containing protein [Myxococcales bacterium]